MTERAKKAKSFYLWSGLCWTGSSPQYMERYTQPLIFWPHLITVNLSSTIVVFLRLFLHIEWGTRYLYTSMSVLYSINFNFWGSISYQSSFILLLRSIYVLNVGLDFTQSIFKIYESDY